MSFTSIVTTLKITDFKNTHIELKNVESKKITKIEVDSVTGEYYGAVRRADFDSLDDFRQINTVAFGKQTPLIEKGQRRRAIAT